MSISPEKEMKPSMSFVGRKKKPLFSHNIIDVAGQLQEAKRIKICYSVSRANAHLRRYDMRWYGLWLNFVLRLIPRHRLDLMCESSGPRYPGSGPAKEWPEPHGWHEARRWSAHTIVIPRGSRAPRGIQGILQNEVVKETWSKEIHCNLRQFTFETSCGSSSLATLVYKPNSPGIPQPRPLDEMPNCSKNPSEFRMVNGPPESPWFKKVWEYQFTRRHVTELLTVWIF